MSNSKIEAVLNATVKLTSFEVNSVVGAMNYLVLNRALQECIRLIPDGPGDAPGSEGVGNYEQAMKRPEIQKICAPLLGMADRFAQVLNEYGTQPIQTVEGVLGFRLERAPLRSTFEAEFNARKRRGEEPAGGARRFIDDNFAIAMRAQATLKAKGEIAVFELSKVDGTDEDVGEFVVDLLIQKAEDKLRARWYAQDDRTTSSMLDQNQKDEARADRDLITAAMEELGMEPPVAPKRGTPEIEVQKAAYVAPVGRNRSAELADFFKENEGVDAQKKDEEKE
jgi:hypothetical protein